jgi:hypothetical protein
MHSLLVDDISSWPYSVKTFFWLSAEIVSVFHLTARVRASSTRRERKIDALIEATRLCKRPFVIGIVLNITPSLSLKKNTQKWAAASLSSCSWFDCVCLVLLPKCVWECRAVLIKLPNTSCENKCLVVAVLVSSFFLFSGSCKTVCTVLWCTCTGSCLPRRDSRCVALQQSPPLRRIFLNV